MTIMLLELAMQTVGDAKEILTLKEVTIPGIMFLVIVIQAIVIRHLYLRLNKIVDDRLEDHKEFTRETLQITEKTSNTVRQVNEILRLTNINRDAQTK